MTYLSTTQSTQNGKRILRLLPAPSNTDIIHAACELQAYQNDLNRMNKEIDGLSMQHAILSKWDMQGLKAYDHEVRRQKEVEILSKMRVAKALETHIASLMGA
jgi:hypothetical protein